VPSRRSIATAILLGGLVAATLDISAASLISGKAPGFILQFIASGLIGKPAFEGGLGTMILGAALQELMGLMIAAVFVLSSLRLPWLRRRWVAAGLAYGAVIFVVMNYVVVPLSAIGRVPRFTPESFAKNLMVMLAFGLIVSAFARWRLGAERATPR
jgi:hypothetical protein